MKYEPDAEIVESLLESYSESGINDALDVAAGRILLVWESNNRIIARNDVQRGINGRRVHCGGVTVSDFRFAEIGQRKEKEQGKAYLTGLACDPKEPDDEDGERWDGQE